MKSIEKRILQALMSAYIKPGQRGQLGQMTPQTLMDDLGCDAQSLKNAVDKLDDSGELHVAEMVTGIGFHLLWLTDSGFVTAEALLPQDEQFARNMDRRKILDFAKRLPDRKPRLSYPDLLREFGEVEGENGGFDEHAHIRLYVAMTGLEGLLLILKKRGKMSRSSDQVGRPGRVTKPAFRSLDVLWPLCVANSDLRI